MKNGTFSPTKRGNHSCLKIKMNQMHRGVWKWILKQNNKKRQPGCPWALEGKAAPDSDGEFSTLAFPFPPPPNSLSASELPDTARWQRPNNNDTFFLSVTKQLWEHQGPTCQALGPQEAEPQASSLFPSLEGASGSLALHPVLSHGYRSDEEWVVFRWQHRLAVWGGRKARGQGRVAWLISEIKA